MHKITFFPVGNGDSCMIDLHNGTKMLFDYANLTTGTKDDLRIDLGKALQEELKQDRRDYFDVVGFTHADDDHVCGASDFFYLEHAAKYQSNTRIKINELWVPAAMILEENLDGDARIIRQEARHRLIQGKGIRVFSRPDRLKRWLESNGLTLEKRKHLITDAGQLVPGFQKMSHGVEFFVHSPFAEHIGNTLIDRNECSLILHATFLISGIETKFLLIGDSTHEVLTDIVNITKFHHNETRLKWDIFDIPHHCSYLALNDEKGKNKTVPVEEVKWLLEQGARRGILVSSSNSIPSNDENTQPPHRQAANCYKEYANIINGEFRATMEFPSKTSPEKMVITIDGAGATLKKAIASGINVITSQPSPRAGN